ncbi:MAG: hypothetical protein JWN67_473 [Actinomycetia bacterium]|nr:hypothetical protein [Actinomycetes bacterium]
MVKRRLLGVLLLTALIGTVITTTASATSSTAGGGYGAAQAAANPFVDQSAFCKSGTPIAPGTRNSSSPGVTPSEITVTDMSIDTAALRRLTGSDLQDFYAAYRAFWNEVNKCGGINGRKINYKVAKYNPVAPDQTGHLQALCLKATEDYKSFLVVATGPPQVQNCVAIKHKTIMLASTGVLDSEYKDSKGRIVTFTPGGDASARVFIADAKSQGTFKGKTVAILGANNTPTAIGDQQRQYVDGFKNAGIDVATYEVLPCLGTVCTQGLAGAIGRLKSKNVDAIVMTQNVSITTVGSIWRELRSQGLKVPVYNAFTDSLNGDSGLGALIRSAGADGANFAESAGWYATKLYDIHNGWRIGSSKETPFAKMCTATLAKANNERQYLYNEQDISNGRWGGTTIICQHVRAMASAIWSLGANVTTERMVAALRNEKRVDYWDTGASFRDKQWFMDGQLDPTKAMTAKFTFPCPLPKLTPGEGCFLAVDRPARVRTIPTK